mgnify:CR=1 FL=1
MPRILELCSGTGGVSKFFVDQGLFQDVSDVWADAGLNDSMASSKGSLTVDGKQYGVPWGYYQWGVYYRKDIFDNFSDGHCNTKGYFPKRYML